MPLVQEPTLATLRSELASDLGFGTVGVANVLKTRLNSFLARSQQDLWDRFDFPLLLQVWAPTLASGARWLDYPDGDPGAWAGTTAYTADQLRRPTSANGLQYRVTTAGTSAGSEPTWPTAHGGTVVDGTVTWTCVGPVFACDPERIAEIRVIHATTQRAMLVEGIDYVHDSVRDSATYPRRFERRERLEIWPVADQAYTVEIEGYPQLLAFSADTDRCTIPNRLLFSVALARAKKSYRHPDANDAQAEANAMLQRLRARAHGAKRYGAASFRGTSAAPRSRPVLVGGDF